VRYGNGRVWVLKGRCRMREEANKARYYKKLPSVKEVEIPLMVNLKKTIQKPKKVWVATIVYENGDEVFVGKTKASVEVQVYEWVKSCWESESLYKGIEMSKIPTKAIKQYFDIAVEAGESCSCDIVERELR